MLDNYNNPLYPPVTIIRTLLNFVLRYNCFSFGELFFLQVRGVAMGTKLVANPVMLVKWLKIPTRNLVQLH